MEWQTQLAQMIKDQMPYCFSLKGGKRQEMDVREFQLMVGYLYEFVEMERKKCFMEGYARGMAEVIVNKLGENDLECSRHHAERSWEEFER